MKTRILILLISTLSLSSFAQSEISGTITYYFNAYQGDKLDIGAKIYLIDSIGYANIENSDLLYNFNIVDLSRELVAYSFKEKEKLANDPDYKKLLSSKSKMEKKGKNLTDVEKFNAIIDQLNPYEEKIEKKEKEIQSYMETIDKYEAGTSSEWEEFCTKCILPMTNLEYNLDKNVKSTTVDGTGRYTLKDVKDGIYYLMIKSNNRTGMNTVTIQGKIDVKKITIEGESIDISHKFNM